MSEVKIGLDKVSRHSHIKGLGLDTQGFASADDCGFIGQKQAREAAGLVVDLVKERKMAGRALLITGKPGTGKTALALGMAQELGSRVPFAMMAGSQAYSAEVSKPEVLKEHLRRAIGLKIKETKDVYEGEVLELTPVEAENPLGYGKALSHILVTLRAQKGTKKLRLDPSIIEGIQKERVLVGDVVYIEAGTGSVRRIGRLDAHMGQNDLDADEYVPLPKGEVFKQKQITQEVTLHELDIANAKPVGDDLAGLLSKGKQRTEVTDKLRDEVNKIVDKFLSQGTAELVPGILFVDEVHMLDSECFAFLTRALETPLAPTVVLATNRAVSAVKGTDDLAPHGIPTDLLERVLIIRTSEYSIEEAKRILSLRAKTEGIILENSALELLAVTAGKTSLRHALQILTPAKVASEISGADKVGVQDVQSIQELFLDPSRSISR